MLNPKKCLILAACRAFKESQTHSGRQPLGMHPPPPLLPSHTLEVGSARARAGCSVPYPGRF